MKTHLIYFILLAFAVAQSVNIYAEEKWPKKDSVIILTTNVNGKGLSMELQFEKGKAHSHALIAIWIEDLAGNYIQTLYVSKSIATGLFEHGKQGNHKWEPDIITRPATLPYWAHKRNIKNDKDSYMPSPGTTVPDAYSGATPLDNFILKTSTDKPLEKFRLMFEINQPFDFNEYWTNSKFQDNKAYHTSGQPALVYYVSIDSSDPEELYYMHAIGHSHYAGKNGKLFTNLTTMTSAMNIVKYITVKLIE